MRGISVLLLSGLIGLVAGTCTSGGTTYQDGDTFKEGCFTYKCVGTNKSYQSGACSTGGVCVDVSKTHKMGCSTLTCILKDNMFQFEVTIPMCSISNTCVAAGQTHNCIKCVESNSTSDFPSFESECQHGSQCYPDGHKMEIGNCQYTCDISGGSVGFKKDDASCS